MKMLASDIDKTLTFSKKYAKNCVEELVCVEKLEGEDFGYISKKALEKLENLKATTLVVPVTTRSIEQFQRVKLGEFDYAITSNGGKIFKHGVEDLNWSNLVKQEIEKLGKFFDEVIDFMSKYNSYFTKPFRCVDGIFYYSKFNATKEEICEVVKYLEENLDKTKWIYTIQSLKLYIIPKNVNKESAVRYVYEKSDCNILACAGDGKLDLGFLQIADVAIIPKESEVLEYADGLKHKSVSKHYLGTYEMLSYFEDLKPLGNF